jgi:hypothetical protein
MPNRTEAAKRKRCQIATGRPPSQRLFSTLHKSRTRTSPVNALNRELSQTSAIDRARWLQREVADPHTPEADRSP